MSVINRTICWDFEKNPIEVVDNTIKLKFAKIFINEISSYRRNRNGWRGNAPNFIREKFPLHGIDSRSIRKIGGEKGRLWW